MLFKFLVIHDDFNQDVGFVPSGCWYETNKLKSCAEKWQNCRQLLYDINETTALVIFIATFSL